MLTNKKLEFRKRLMVCLMLFLLPITLIKYTYAKNRTEFSPEDIVMLWEVSSELPSWQSIKEVYESKIEIQSTEQAKKKKELSIAIVTGFGKKINYDKFKTLMFEYSKYDSTTKEFTPIDETIESEENFKQAIKMFDKAMILSSVKVMTGSTVNDDGTSWFSRMFKKVSDFIISMITIVMFEAGRLSITFAGLCFIAENLYLSVEMLRPILGFEYIPGKRKRNLLSEESYNDKTQYARAFRIVGASARAAVEKEYDINRDASVLVKNNIFLSFLAGKFLYIIVFILSVIIINTNGWAVVCINLISGIIDFFS